MTFIDHLKNNSPENLMLEVAFGFHAVGGDLAKSIVTGVSPTHVVKIQNLLGDAFGKGWSGPLGVWFRGTMRNSTKYKFYPGIISPGNADAIQGIDSVFDQDTPHSNSAWIRVECPNGSEVGIPDFDTKNNPPTGLQIIMGCQLGDIYDSTGTVITSNILITNPADLIAFGCKEIRRYDSSRIDWASLATLRTAANTPRLPDYTTLPQGVGLTGKYYEGTAFNTFKSQRVDPVIQYDLSPGAPALNLTPTSFSVRYEGKIRFKYTETYTMYLTHNDSGKLWINNLSTAIIDEAVTGTHSATFTATANQWYDIKMEWSNAAGDSQFMLEWQSATQSRQVVPQDRLYPLAENVSRFQSHLKFTTRTTFDEFLRSVLFTCNGSYQDINGKLKFFIIDDLAASFDFDETNIIKDTFKFYPRFTQLELLQMPNRFVADGRDLDSRYLEAFDPPLVYDLPVLQDTAGRVIEETVSVGNTTRWQGIKNLAHYAKLKTAPIVAEFDGMPQTLPVLHGDVVTVSHSIPGWVKKQFICIAATDKSIGTSADERAFKLYEWAETGIITLIARAAANSTGSGSTPGVTSIIDTTGASILVAAGSYYSLGGTPVLTDSKGNTWQALTARVVSGGVAVRLYYCKNPVVGPAHTFTFGASGAYASFAVAAFNETDVTANADAENGASATAATLQPGSITPSSDRCLIISAVGGSQAGQSIDSGFNITDSIPYSFGNYNQVSLAYKLQTSASAENPTWNLGTASGFAVAIAAFKHS